MTPGDAKFAPTMFLGMPDVITPGDAIFVPTTFIGILDTALPTGYIAEGINGFAVGKTDTAVGAVIAGTEEKIVGADAIGALMKGTATGTATGAIAPAIRRPSPTRARIPKGTAIGIAIAAALVLL